MIRQIFSTLFFSIGIGFVSQLGQIWLESYYLNEFLKANLINLLIALLAINTATMGIVLTKIRDLVEGYGHGEVFKNTRKQMLLSIKEQVVLIVLGVVVLTIADSSKLASTLDHFDLFIKSVVAAVFIYSIKILYDVATSVLLIVDFNIED